MPSPVAAEKLGLAGKTGIDLPNEQESIVPSTEWKMKRYGEKCMLGETISVSIGQGQVSVTPASLAVMILTVANGGTRVTPHVLKAIDEGDGWKPVPAPAVAITSPSSPRTLSGGLRRPVARRQRQRDGHPRPDSRLRCGGQNRHRAGHLHPGRLAAKGSDKDLRDHGFFVFFAPRDNPQMA